MPDEKVSANWALYISIERIGLKHIKRFSYPCDEAMLFDILLSNMKKDSLLKLSLINYWYIWFDAMPKPLNRIMQGQKTVTKDDIDNMKTLNIMYTCET